MSGHWHASGFMQSPPLEQEGLQTAVEEDRKYLCSSILYYEWLPCWQWSPSHISGHLQVPGSVQLPPLEQEGLQ